jgi:predicted outer membrane repeat protein
MSGQSSLQIIGSSFKSNYAKYNGGAIYASGYTFMTMDSITF